MIDRLLEYQQKRDKLNKKIEEQFNIILMEGYTLEEKREASEKHNKLINEYLKLVDNMKDISEKRIKKLYFSTGDELAEYFYRFKSGERYTIKINNEVVTFNNWANDGNELNLYIQNIEDMDELKLVFRIDLNDFPFSIEEEGNRVNIIYVIW